jgi:biopolymer transport protein TolR
MLEVFLDATGRRREVPMIFSTGKAVSSDINITPMIDILLVLLIIFMAITPVPPKGLEALLPQSPREDRASTQENPVVLQISYTNNGQLAYKINQTNVGRDEIRGKLQTIFSTHSAKVMFIQGDKDLDFSPIARSMDLARSAGIDHVGLITRRIAANR